MADLDLANAFDLVQRVVHSNCSVEAGMRTLITECEHRAADPDWERFLAIDYPSDVERVGRWLARAFKSPPSPELTGLWFGLFNPVENDGDASCDLRVHADVYDPDDEWAIYGRWQPDDEGARSSALRDIYRIAYRSDRPDHLGNDAEYPLCLGYAGLAIRTILSGPGANDLFSGADARVAVVGWDDGDSILIGTLSRTGFAIGTRG